MTSPCAPVFSFHRCRACMGAKAYPFLRTAFSARTRFCGPHWQPTGSRLEPIGGRIDSPMASPTAGPTARPIAGPVAGTQCTLRAKARPGHGIDRARNPHRPPAMRGRTVPVSASCELRPMPRGVPCVPVSAYTTSVESRLSDVSTSRHRRADAARSRPGIKRWYRPRRRRRATRRRSSPMPAANRRRPPCWRLPPPWPRAGGSSWADAP